jgi:hypothetical protein
MFPSTGQQQKILPTGNPKTRKADETEKSEDLSEDELASRLSEKLKQLE